MNAFSSETLERVANPGASQAAIEHHYDVGNEFFELWLDKAMTYSCAIFPGDVDLDFAQQIKVDRHLDACRAKDAGRLLDIGCGWGAGVSRAATEFRAREVTGLTLSPSQAEYIRSRYVSGEGLDNINIRVESWSDHQPSQPYDAILSLGAFEHFARPGVSREEKVAGYRDFFERCHRWLRPEGRLALQTIAWGKVGITEAGNTFIMEEIYPETDVPELSEICDAIKGLFEVRTMETDRDAYVLTLKEWRRRLRARRDEAIALAGREIYDRYERYLGLCALAFHSGNLTLSRWAFSRID